MATVRKLASPSACGFMSAIVFLILYTILSGTDRGFVWNSVLATPVYVITYQLLESFFPRFVFTSFWPRVPLALFWFSVGFAVRLACKDNRLTLFVWIVFLLFYALSGYAITLLSFMGPG